MRRRNPHGRHRRYCAACRDARQRKLLEKQKAGKKRMRQFGKVDVRQ